MKFKFAKELNSALLTSINVVEIVFKTHDAEINDLFKEQNCKERLDEINDKFLEELKENIYDYKITENIIDYLNASFEEFLMWEGFKISDQVIIQNSRTSGAVIKQII